MEIPYTNVVAGLSALDSISLDSHGYSSGYTKPKHTRSRRGMKKRNRKKMQKASRKANRQ